MNSSSLNSAIFEISLNIGTSLDIKKVINDALSSYIRQLDCIGIALIETNEEDFSIHSSKPKNLIHNPNLNSCILHLKNNYNELKIEYFNKKETFEFKIDDELYYIYELKDFGFLIFIKNNSRFTKEVTKALSQINDKFTNSLLACKEIERSRDNELLLLHQSKMASMGEMIGNIAHQWRQPLSAITSSTSSLILQKQLNMLSDEELIEALENIAGKAKYLSNTIEIFRDYLKDNKELQRVTIQDLVNKDLEIINSSLNVHYIKVINNLKNIPDIQIETITGELSQVFINIISNAKDVLLEEEINKPWIKLDIVENADFITLSIEDNGGGVPENIIDKIFNPYFTTKHQSQGTGLGLHMCYKIITESLNGKINVENTNNGAKFNIELPKKL